MNNINFFGGPAVGKSTVAAGLFYELKKSGEKVEYVTEYAKELVFSKDTYKLQDQTYILAKQHHSLFKLQDQVDILINDGPFLLGLVYLQDRDGFPAEEFKKYLLALWGSYNHINIFIDRDLSSFEYEEIGRNESLNESIELDIKIKKLLDDNNIEYYTVKSGELILEEVLKVLKNSPLLG